MEVLTKEAIAPFKDAARRLTGPKRRAFEAQVTLDYLGGNIWKAEKVFGWSHHTVALAVPAREAAILVRLAAYHAPLVRLAVLTGRRVALLQDVRV